MAGKLEYHRQFLSYKRLNLGPWSAFERDLARLLEHGGFKDVEVVGGSGDQGADVVANKGKQRWVVQAKYRKPGVKIGKDALIEVFKAKEKYEADVCVVATNQYFSKEAEELKIKENFGHKIHFWNRDKLLKLCDGIDLKSKNLRKPAVAKKAIQNIYDEIENGGNKGLLTLATGLGKTVIATSIINRYLEDNPNSNILVLAHMRDLVRQLEKASWSQFDKNIVTHLWTDREKPAFLEGVIFATWQSISSALNNGALAPKQFDLIIVDECHHAPSKEYSGLLNKLNPNFLLGVTATPWRDDKKSIKEIFGKPLYSMNVVQGMKKGYLAEVDYLMLTDDIDWDDIYNRSINGYTIKDLNQRLYVPERDLSMVEEIVNTIKVTNNAKVLVFCRSIPHAKKLRSYFKKFDFPASLLHSDLDRTERFKALSNFRMGTVSILISIEMLNEGIDVPAVNIVTFARVTHSRRIFYNNLEEAYEYLMIKIK